jgi:Tol biopolymer transport system component
VGIINPSDFSYREFSTRFSAHEEFTHCALSKYKLFVLGYDGENSFVKVMDIKSGDIETPFYESKSPGFGFSSYSLSRDGTRIAFTLSRSVTNYSNIYVCGANNAKAFEIVKSKRAFYNCSVLNWTGRKVFFATAANEENKRYFYKVTLKF